MGSTVASMEPDERCLVFRISLKFSSMKQLTCTEKQHLETKIEEEKERQRVRRMNPNTPVASVETNFIFNNLYKYGMLALILGLLGISVRHLLKWGDFAYDEYGNLIVALMLFFHHIAHSFTKTGWKQPCHENRCPSLDSNWIGLHLFSHI